MAWRTKQANADIDVLARKATSSGAHAEEMALARRGARLRREEIRRRDEALRSAEQSTASANQRIQELESDLAKESRARELAEREASVASDHLRDLRVEVARLRDELATYAPKAMRPN